MKSDRLYQKIGDRGEMNALAERIIKVVDELNGRFSCGRGHRARVQLCLSLLTMTENIGWHSYRLWIVAVATYLDVHLEHEDSLRVYNVHDVIAEQLGMQGSDVTKETVYQCVVIWAAAPSVCILQALENVRSSSM